jgi:hypothetical protein
MVVGRAGESRMSMTGRDPDASQRWGPSPLTPDPWEFDPDAEVPNEAYRGVRRADVPRHRRRLHMLGVTAAILAAGVIAAAWIAVAGGPDGENADRVGGDAPTSDPAGVGMGSSSALPSTSVNASPVATTQAGPLLAVEAEAGMPDVKLRAAQVVAQAGASGGKVVRFMNNAGEIELRGIAVPAAGTYRFTIYYAPGAAATGRLAVGGAATMTVSYEGGSGCCSVATVDASVPAGTHNAAITVSIGDGAAPAIDRVVISRS